MTDAEITKRVSPNADYAELKSILAEWVKACDAKGEFVDPPSNLRQRFRVLVQRKECVRGWLRKVARI